MVVGKRKPTAVTHTCLACDQPVATYRDTTMVTHDDAAWNHCPASGTSAHTGNAFMADGPLWRRPEGTDHLFRKT